MTLGRKKKKKEDKKKNFEEEDEDSEEKSVKVMEPKTPTEMKRGPKKKHIFVDIHENENLPRSSSNE